MAILDSGTLMAECAEMSTVDEDGMWEPRYIEPDGILTVKQRDALEAAGLLDGLGQQDIRNPLWERGGMVLVLDNVGTLGSTVFLLCATLEPVRYHADGTNLGRGQMVVVPSTSLSLIQPQQQEPEQKQPSRLVTPPNKGKLIK